MTDAPDLPTTTEGEPLDHGPNYLKLVDVMTDEQFEDCTKKVQSTRNANAQLLRELGEMGFTPEFTVSMLAVYFHGLVEVGIITKAQLATIELNWEQGFNRQLQMMLKSGKEAIEQAQQRAKLLVPPSAAPGPNRQARRAAAKQGLILPGS